MAEPLLHQPVHLSEAYIHRGADSLYVFGEILARLNYAETYFYPDLAKSLMFNRQDGNWMFINANNMHKGGLDPEMASWQFRDLLNVSNQEMFLGLLGGYARKAYQLLDPVYPGFTDELLKQLIGGRILSVTKPRKQLLDMEQVLTAYGVSLDFKQDDKKPALIKISPVAVTVPDEDILLATIVLALAGADVSQWIQQMTAVDNTNNMILILKAISHRDHLNTWDGIVPALLGLTKNKKLLEKLMQKQPYGVQHLLGFMLGIFFEDKTLDSSFRGVGARILRNVTNPLVELAPETRAAFLDAIVDGLDYLAKSADQQGAMRQSIYLAQGSKIILQFLIQDVDGAESRLSRAEMQTYSWEQFVPTETSDPYLTFSMLTFAASANIADTGFFATSCQLVAAEITSNPLWTALWHSLERMRYAIKLAQLLVSKQLDNWQEQELANFTFALENVVTAYLRCLWEFKEGLNATAVEGKPAPGYLEIFSGIPEEDNKMFLYVEKDGVLRLQEALKANGFDKVSQAALQDLAGVLTREQTAV